VLNFGNVNNTEIQTSFKTSETQKT